MVYLAGSYFDAQGTLDIWKIMFFKLVILIGALLSFVAYYLRPSFKEKTIYEI